MNAVFIGMDLRSGVRCACLVFLPSSWHQCRRGVRNDVGARLAPFRDAAEGRFVRTHRASPGCWRRVMYAGGLHGVQRTQQERAVGDRGRYVWPRRVRARRSCRYKAALLLLLPKLPACAAVRVGAQRKGQNTVRTRVVSRSGPIVFVCAADLTGSNCRLFVNVNRSSSQDTD